MPRALRLILPVALALALVSPWASAREEISLAGAWQYVHDGTWDQPPRDGWQEIDIPAEIQTSAENHVAWFRKTFDLPDKLVRQPLFVCFAGVKYRCRAWLNGQPVGEHWGGFEPFMFDISSAARPGANELLLAVGDGTQIAINPPAPHEASPGLRTGTYNDRLLYPVGSRTTQFGIWDRVYLLSLSPVHVADAFVKTSVRRKTIEVDYEVRNVGPRLARVVLSAVVLDGEKEVKPLGQRTLTVPPRGMVTAKLSAPWPDAQLWWPHSPKLYRLRTRISVGGRVVDEHIVRFGFREFWTEGIQLVLNGRPINFLATATHPLGYSREVAQQTYHWIRQANCVAMRLHAQPWSMNWYEVADEVGMLLIHESAVWCYAPQYALTDDRFWENYKKHLEAQVRLHRNNPSVVIWSLENELLHTGGTRYPQCEARLAELGRFVKSLDPTRAILYDADLEVQGVADIINVHYPHEYPDVYQYPQAADWAMEGTPHRVWAKGWRWRKNKPLYVGEFLWCPQRDPAAYTMLLGDDALRDWSSARRRGQALLWKFQVLALRRARVAGMCPWNIFENNKLGYEVNRYCYEPNGAYPRELDSRFFSGELVPRTIDVYNDTLEQKHLLLRWTLGVQRGEVDLGVLQPAALATKTISLRMPLVTQRVDLPWRIEVVGGGEVLFRDEHTISVFPKTQPSFAGLNLGVYDPQGTLKGKVDFGPGATAVASLDNIPPGLDALIVAPGALKRRSAPPAVGRGRAASPLLSYAERGGRVLILPQEALPEGLGLGRLADHAPTMCFVRWRPPGLLDGLRGDDFRFWRGDHIVARKSIVIPDSGAYYVIVESGSSQGLTNAQLLELLPGAGRLVLCQLDIARKLDQEPVAGDLLRRLVRYVASPVPQRAPLLAVDEHSLQVARQTLEGHRVELLSGEPPRGALLFAAGQSAAPPALGRLARAVRQGATLWLHRPPKAVAAAVAQLAQSNFAPTPISSVPIKWATLDDPLTRGATFESLCWLIPSGAGSRTTYHPVPDPADYALTVALPENHGQGIDLSRAELVGSLVTFADGRVTMATNGSVRFAVAAPKDGLYGFLVVLSGTPAARIFPATTFHVDGQFVGGAMLTGPGPERFTFLKRLSAGEHECLISYVNDAVIGGEDRNLYIEEVRFGPAEARPGTLAPLTDPAVLVRAALGAGQIIVDTVRWSDPQRAGTRLARQYAAQLATNLGVASLPRSQVLVLAGARLKPDRPSQLAGPRGDDLFLGTNGAARIRVTFLAAGRYRITVLARGTPVAGVWPQFRVLVDGKPLGTIQLEGDTWQSHSVVAEVSAGEHEVAVEFINDTWQPPEDRNLWLRRLVLAPAEG